MTWKDVVGPVLLRMPVVTRPEGHVSFNKRLVWTGGVLLLYFFLTNVVLFGVASGGSDFFGQFRSILAGEFGTILQLGIGPIVTASIVLQLLGGSNLLGLDLQDPRDQRLYQGLQKVLVLVMIIFTGIPMVFSGGFLPVDSALAQNLGITPFALQAIIFLQIAVGGIIILYMDEVVSKWGIGSGIGLFIVAGVSQRLVGGLFTQIIPSWGRIIQGQTQINPLTSDGLVALFLGEGAILAVLTTIAIFFIVVYAETTRVEIPISNTQIKGATGKWPVKLIYASVLPMILVRALQANIQFLGQILNQSLSLPAWVAQYNSNGQVIGGLFYYFAPIQTPGEWMWFLGLTTAEPWQIGIRVFIDLLFMVVGGAIFALFWIRTTNMGPEAVAQQIHRSGLQIPGFRRNPQVLEKVMQRYIPHVTVIGGALVGLLAVTANMLGTIGGVTGTGLLLMVSILYKLFEEVAKEKAFSMYPMLREMLS